MNDYYNRNAIVHLDGTRVFQSAEDQRNEREIAATLEKTWGCRIAAFGALSPIDWYAERHGRLVGLLEMKSRHHAHDLYEGAFLNVRNGWRSRSARWVWVAPRSSSFAMTTPSTGRQSRASTRPTIALRDARASSRARTTSSRLSMFRLKQ
jgi:hypothetical protein